jgi:hypothetical protein
MAVEESAMHADIRNGVMKFRQNEAFNLLEISE